MSTDLDKAKALGFLSVEECKAHETWLKSLQRHAKQCQEAVRKAEIIGSNTIDIRNIKS